MARPVLLNNIDHKDLRVDTRRLPGLGDDVMSVPTFPAEFRNIQSCYPIVFSKTRDGGFQPVALLGFSEGQNLFLDADGWDAVYLPLAIERQPFLIGVQGEELLLQVDLDSPRLGTGEGEPVFLPHGGTTPYLERINSVLLALYEGLRANTAFVAALLEHELIEPFTLDVEMDDGSRNRLSGFYTINEERLDALDGEALGRLHRAGHLQPIFMAVASTARFRELIERMNHRHGSRR